MTEVLNAGPALAAAGITGNSEKRRPEILTLGILGLGVLLGVVIGWAGLALLRHSPDDAPSWTGTRLDGPSVALSPRLSPDGKTLAFRTFVDGLAQVAVMNPESGNWTAVTRDRTRGYVSTISWSLDATRIYYTRFDGVPRGIYSVPALGGEERLILENAAGAEPLPDGSLLVARTNANRQAQMYRYWARDGRLDPLPGILMNSEGPSIRVFRDGLRAVFWGRSMDQASSDPSSLSVSDGHRSGEPHEGAHGHSTTSGRGGRNSARHPAGRCIGCRGGYEWRRAQSRCSTRSILPAGSEH